MTREEKQKAIDVLKISVPIKALTQEEFNDYIQTLNKIMDWLEQEPFKPMVEIDLDYVIKQKYIEREVLDKLRAELHATAEMHEDGGYYIRDEWIDEYFDKYKAESERTNES